MSKVPHKHAAVIKAWADGARIQFRVADGIWTSYSSVSRVPQFSEDIEHRIQPELQSGLDSDDLRLEYDIGYKSGGHFAGLHAVADAALTYAVQTGQLKETSV